VRLSDPTDPRGMAVRSPGIDSSPRQPSPQHGKFVVDARIEKDRLQARQMLRSQHQIPKRSAASRALATQTLYPQVPRQVLPASSEPSNLKDALDWRSA
jgi:hypothetical protein